METDKEVSGTGNSFTTEFRQYDPRLGRWKSLDPLMMMFPDMSPYCAFDNNPVIYTDPYGLAAGGGNPDTYNTGEQAEGSSSCGGDELPSNPTNGQIFTDSKGNDYIYIIGDNGVGGWGRLIPEIQFVGKIDFYKNLEERLTELGKNENSTSKELDPNTRISCLTSEVTQVKKSNSNSNKPVETREVPGTRREVDFPSNNPNEANSLTFIPKGGNTSIVGLIILTYAAIQQLHNLDQVCYTSDIEIVSSDEVEDNVNNAASEKMEGAQVSSSSPQIDPDDFDEYDDIDDLINNSGELERLKGGVKQGNVNGNANTIFENLSKKYNAEIQVGKNGERFFKSGNLRVGLHDSTLGNGKPTIHINNNGVLYKIRVIP